MIVPLDSFLITFNVPALMLYAPEPACFLMARTTRLICWGCSFSLSNSLSMRSRSISSVAGGLEYTWFLMWPHKKMSHGVRSGLLGGHSWQNPRPKNPISKHFMKLVSDIETSVGWCTVLHEPNVPSHISICFWNWWQNSIIKHVCTWFQSAFLNRKKALWHTHCHKLLSTKKAFQFECFFQRQILLVDSLTRSVYSGYWQYHPLQMLPRQSLSICLKYLISLQNSVTEGHSSTIIIWHQLMLLLHFVSLQSDWVRCSVVDEK